MAADPYRLSRTVVPSHYVLTLAPDLEAATFTGRAAIEVEVTERVSEIVLNAAELDIDRAELVDYRGERITAAVSLDERAQRASLTVPQEMVPGPWRLEIEFRGRLNDQLRGFYRSTYTDAHGDEKVIATTQLAAAEARRAFPCWDEPSFKATFDVTLIVEQHLTAISNGPEISRSPTNDGKAAVRFATTMKMSTYLVAFIVGEMETTDPLEVDGIALRVVHTPGKGHLTGLALDSGAFSLSFFRDYYGIPYPGEKLDLIGIPDFTHGAMENLGAVTFRESALLVDPKQASHNEKVRVVEVVAHEIAHMWFGDLVTMEWWNGFWLNEAFATFMEHLCVDAFRPDWQRWLAAAPERAAAMHVDALTATRPVEFPVRSPRDVTVMVDVLTYQKGSAVLRMLQRYLGEEVFRAGIRLYLERHAYGNTTADDLWAALEEVSGEPVGELMQAWIFEGGFPQIHVSGNDATYQLEQERFAYLGEGGPQWRIPVRYRSSSGEGAILLGERSFIDAGPDLLLNVGGDGFYRVHYQGDLATNLRNRLTRLDSVERFATVSDVWANALAAKHDAGTVLELISELDEEHDVEVWSAAFAALSALDRIASDDERTQLQQYVVDLTEPMVSALGWQVATSETSRRRRLRAALLRARGVLGDDGETKARARRVVDETLRGRPADPDLATAALGIVAARGTMSDYERFASARKGATTPQDEARYLRAMCAVPHAQALHRTFAMTTTAELRSHDIRTVVILLVGHRTLGPQAWYLLEGNWDSIMEVNPPATRHHLIDGITARSEPEMAADVEAWLGDHPFPGAELHVAQRLELMRVLVALRERERGRLGSYLAL